MSHNILNILFLIVKFLFFNSLSDLSFNDLREWRVDRRNNELQSLNHLDATGNEHWLPSEQLLQLNNLKTVKGVKISRYFENCLLFMKGKNVLSEVALSQQESVSDVPPKFDVAIKAVYCMYATGSVALVVNITVFLVIVFNKSLRGELAVWLVLNITLSDVFIGLATVLYAKFNFVTLRIDNQEGNYLLRNIMGSILTCAVVSQVFGSFILTLEKFLKIVFAMKPDIRIRKRGAILFLFLSWSVSLTFAVLPAFVVGGTEYTDFTPLPADNSVHDFTAPVGIALVSQIILLVIQLTSFVLYLPMFIVAKRSGANVGIKREAAIARKIALLVFTNLIFFTFPVVFGILQFKILERVRKSHWEITERKWVYFAFFCFPVLCVSVNSILNPFLYALRHPKIKQQLRPVVSHCRTALSECFVDLRQRLHCHSNAVQPENDMEMQDPKL